MSGPPRLVVLVGPTASGKTALACALAARLEAEVISADSQQCYRGLDAGTAKPSADERARAPHHLLDVADPEEQLDAATYVRLADEAIAQVQARGKRALVVGGTGLWIRALLRGLLDAPGADAAFRARFREELQECGLPAMHARLAAVDAAAAAGILPGDRVRIERALEVHALTGRPLSELQRAHRFAEARYAARVVLLEPPRELLWARIAARTQALFAPEGDGPLVRETRALLQRIERVPAAARALKIIGYGEAAAALEQAGRAQGVPAQAARPEPAALREAEQAVAARTRQYAKRQRTWFRKDAPALDALSSPLVVAAGERALPAPGGAGRGKQANPTFRLSTFDFQLSEDAEGLFAPLIEWYEAAR